MNSEPVDELFSRHNIDRINRLKRRRDYLSNRIFSGEIDGKELSFDKGEMSALEWAINTLLELPQLITKAQTDSYKKGWQDAMNQENVNVPEVKNG